MRINESMPSFELYIYLVKLKNKSKEEYAKFFDDLIEVATDLRITMNGMERLHMIDHGAAHNGREWYGIEELPDTKLNPIEGLPVVPIETIYQKIKEKTGLSDQEIDAKVQAKLDALSGLISKNGAVHIIANEHDVSIYEKPE